MKRKTEKNYPKYQYSREHYNKEVRREVLGNVKKIENERIIFLNKGRKRKKQRMWTLNRSPHGNKTAREQFGRQIWQRIVEVQRISEYEKNDPMQRRKQAVESQSEYVNRKEKKYSVSK